jgi:hypothetical protein
MGSPTCKHPEFVAILIVSRVARWFVFKPKIQIWVNFGWSCNGRGWYILWTLGPLFYLIDIRYSSL